MAQLGARVNGIHEVTGSIPVWSTILRSRCRRRLPRRSVRSDAKAGCPCPLNELRLASHASQARSVNPDQNPPDRVRRDCQRCSADRAISTHFQFQPSASALPSVSHAEADDSSTFSRVPTPKAHFYIGLTPRRPRPPRRSQRRPLPAHRAVPPLATPRHHRTPRRAMGCRLERYLKSGSGRAFAKRHFG